MTFLAILAANAIAVPLAPAFPAPELRYILNLSEAIVLVSSGKYAEKAAEVLGHGLDSLPLCYQVGQGADASPEAKGVLLRGFSSTRSGGMMLFTSGTTARPKGVVLSLANLATQASSLVEAWRYVPSDRLLHVLPLHHIHGTVNALLAPVLAGSSIEFMFPFNVDSVWKRLATPFLHAKSVQATDGPVNATRTPISFFTAVPTI